MKFIAIIFSVYLVLLTVKPCIDAPIENKLHKIEIAGQETNNHEHGNSDNCSPFCTCNCCATSVIMQEYAVQLTCFSFTGKQYFPVSYGFVSDPSVSIWQPPKVA
jgi:hypothetical protein